MPFSETYTFDIVFVKEEYRGLGLQKAFVDIAKEQSKIDGAKYIMTTVSKDNTHSYNNMVSEGFNVYKENVPMYGGLPRVVLKLDVDK